MTLSVPEAHRRGNGLPASRRIQTWLIEALATSGMHQAELGRRLAVALNRPVERGTIHALVIGARTLKADEMLEIAQICRVPLPSVREKKSTPQEPRLPGFDAPERRAS